MKVISIPCAEFVNESERRAFEEIKQKLAALPGAGEWIVLSNISHSSSPRFQSDEIDLLAIGPHGVFVIEVKHWDRFWMKSRTDQVDGEADKLSHKVRRVATHARRSYPALGRISGRILLTAEPKAIGSKDRLTHRGVEFFTLKELKELLNLDEPAQLTPDTVRMLCRELEPLTKATVGSIRRLGDFLNLVFIEGDDQQFHRVYRGQHARTQDKLIVHLYDLSALDVKNVENLAAREFETMQHLQKSPWVPRFRDSLQDLQGFVGEMKFFTVVDPCAPTIRARKGDVNWSIQQRIEFTHRAVQALADLHGNELDDAVPVVHRGLTPSTILVTARNSVLFTGFSLSRLPGQETVAKSPLPPGECADFAAPEVRSGGLSAADLRSDVYSLALSLKTIFQDRSEEESVKCLALLSAAATSENPPRSVLRCNSWQLPWSRCLNPQRRRLKLPRHCLLSSPPNCRFRAIGPTT